MKVEGYFLRLFAKAVYSDIIANLCMPVCGG
jgi:hypothetical protein